MARTAKTPVARAADVQAAILELPEAFERAAKALREYGPTDQRTLKAWEAVEIHGATVHRQSRLLAGKSRGG